MLQPFNGRLTLKYSLVYAICRFDLQTNHHATVQPIVLVRWQGNHGNQDSSEIKGMESRDKDQTWKTDKHNKEREVTKSNKKRKWMRNSNSN